MVHIDEMDVFWVAEDGYFRVEFRGLRTLEGITSMAEWTTENARRTGCFRYLFDLRGSQEGVTVDDKYLIGVYFAEILESRFTVIVLIERSQNSGFVENVSVNRGLNRFRVLDDEAQAIALVKSL